MHYLGVNEKRWSARATKMLLAEYAERKEDFRSPKIKKKILWKSIADKLCESGFMHGADEVDRKMRNLKRTFIKVKENN